MATPGASTAVVIETPVSSATKKYQCEHCNLTIIYKRNMYTHQCSHLRLKLYKSKFCKKGSTQSSILKKHVSVLPRISKKFSCTDCDYTTKWKKNLTQHRLAKHSVVKPFACPYCEFTTAYSYSLQNHIPRHTGEKRYTCPHCEYACIQRSSMNNHLMTKHTGVINRKCIHCDYSSIDCGNTNKHIKTHTGIKNHKCPHCEFSYISSQVKRHIKSRQTGVKSRSSNVNTAEKRVLAPDCEFWNWTPAELQALSELEALISHPQKPSFFCAQCGEDFDTKRSLTVHVKHHVILADLQALCYPSTDPQI